MEHANDCLVKLHNNLHGLVYVNAELQILISGIIHKILSDLNSLDGYSWSYILISNLEFWNQYI
jgi:hypothetical protein